MKYLFLALTFVSFASFGQVLIDPGQTPTTARINAALTGSVGASGTDTYTGSLTGITSYTNLSLDIQFTNANTGTSTFNLNSLGAKTLKKYSSGSLVDLESGDISSGQRIRFYYNGTYLVMMNSGGSNANGLQQGANILTEELLIDGTYGVYFGINTAPPEYQFNADFGGNQSDFHINSDQLFYNTTASASFRVAEDYNKLSTAGELQLGIGQGLNLNGAYGSDGDVFTSHGSSSPPTWETPGGGGSGWATSGSTSVTTPTIVGDPTFNGSPIVSGTSTQFDVINTSTNGGGLRILPKGDGSGDTYFENRSGGTGTTNFFRINTGLSFNPPGVTAQEHILGLANVDQSVGYSVSGTITNGAGGGKPFFSNTTLMGGSYWIHQNNSTAGNSASVINQLLAANGGGSAYTFYRTGSNIDTYVGNFTTHSNSFIIDHNGHTHLTGTTDGRIGFYNLSPTAQLHFPAGLSTAGFAPVKFTEGPLLTTPESGAMEYSTDLFFTTPDGTRSKLTNQAGNKVKLSGTPISFGDSFTQGYLASPSTYGYVDQLSAINGVTFNNQGISGTGATSAAITSFSVLPTYNNANSVTLMCGFNDVRRGGSASATLIKIQGGHRAVLANAWLKFGIAASAVTNTGTWSNYTTITGKAVNLSGNMRKSSTSGDVLSYTTTVATDNIVIGTVNTDGSTYDYGRFTVDIDGTVVQTFNPNGRADLQSDGVTDNGVSPEALIFTNLNNDVHTVTITLLDSKTTVIDYIGFLNAPEKCVGVFVGSPARMDVTGYNTSPANASDAVMSALKQAIKEVLDSFLGRPVYYADLDQFYSTTTGLNSSDHIHPNNVGYGQIANAFQKGIEPSTNTGSISVTHLSGSGTSPSFSVGSGAGTSYSFSNASHVTDLAGDFEITAGTSPSSSATLVTVTFHTPYTTAPFVQLTPRTEAAAAIMPSIYVTSTTTAFVVHVGATALTAAAQYDFNYLVSE